MPALTCSQYIRASAVGHATVLTVEDRLGAAGAEEGENDGVQAAGPPAELRRGPLCPPRRSAACEWVGARPLRARHRAAVAQRRESRRLLAAADHVLVAR